MSEEEIETPAPYVSNFTGNNWYFEEVNDNPGDGKTWETSFNDINQLKTSACTGDRIFYKKQNLQILMIEIQEQSVLISIFFSNYVFDDIEKIDNAFNAIKELNSILN